MKLKFITSILLFSGLSLNITKAAVLTVSNNTALPGSPGQYSTISSALTAASNGDTILIQPSPLPYNESLNITKSLTLIGAGYNPQNNNNYFSKINGSISFKDGSSNCKLIGLWVSSSIGFSNQFANVSEFLFSRCYFESSINLFNGGPATSNQASGFTVENCYVAGAIWYAYSSITVRNCILGSRIQDATNTSTTTLYIRNNLFLNSSTPLYYVQNSVFENNIFWGLTTLDPNLVKNNTFNNNYVYGSFNLPFATNVGSGNITDQVSPYNGNPSPFSVSFNYRPLPGSAIANAGTDSKDIGPTGGAFPIYLYPAPYPLTGEPNIPQIQTINMPVSSAPQGGNINVTVKARNRK
jgi:hypothetical protein